MAPSCYFTQHVAACTSPPGQQGAKERKSRGTQLSEIEEKTEKIHKNVIIGSVNENKPTQNEVNQLKDLDRFNLCLTKTIG